MEKSIIIAILTIFALAYIQNISFSIVSRSRNRNNIKYHLIAATASNTIWFLTFRELVLANMTITLLIPYVVATVLGSVSGVKVSMWIENLLGATADGHIDKQNIYDPFEAKLYDIYISYRTYILQKIYHQIFVSPTDNHINFSSRNKLIKDEMLRIIIQNKHLHPKNIEKFKKEYEIIFNNELPEFIKIKNKK